MAGKTYTHSVTWSHLEVLNRVVYKVKDVLWLDYVERLYSIGFLQQCGQSCCCEIFS